MSGSDAGVMANSSGGANSIEQFNVGLQQKSPVMPSHPQPVIQNMRLAYSADASAVYKPVIASSSSPTYRRQPSPAAVGDGSAGGINFNMASGSEPMKRKRGRPRKYGPDGTMALALVSASQSISATQPTAGAAGAGADAGGFSPPPPPSIASAIIAPGVGAAAIAPATPSSGGPISSPTAKKARGRPPGSSKKKQLDALGSSGSGFTPHVITVNAGEDVASNIMALSQHGKRAVCIMSAVGAISNVTIRQQATSGGTVTYEGKFEILSLVGSFLPSENGGQRSRTGGLSVCLSGSDGRVLGGCVAGLLTAATPVQVVVASFIVDGRKESKAANQIVTSSAARVASTSGPTEASSPPSRGTISESSAGPGNPLIQNAAANNNDPQGLSSMHGTEPLQLSSD